MTSQTNTPPPHQSSTTTTTNIARVLIDFNLWGIIQLLVISTKTETHSAVSLGLRFRQPNIRMQNLLCVRNKDGRPFWPDFGYFGLFGLSGRKTIGGVKTIEMWWWFVVVERKRQKCGGGCVQFHYLQTRNSDKQTESNVGKFESNLISTPRAKKMMIIFHCFQIAVYLTLFVIGFQ